MAAAATVTILLVGCGGDEEDEEQAPSFSYSGAEGPANWGSLDPAYEACSTGTRQSPIALTDATGRELPEIDFSYQPATGVEAENNGHSVEFPYPTGSSIEIEGKSFGFKQLHFHAPSEHTLNGRSFPLEFHFVHQADDEEVAVLGVFGEQGRANPAFSRLVQALPAAEGEKLPVEGEVDALSLLPEAASSAPRWSYEGSLTTPPCTEPVRWNVYNDPIELSREQIAAFTAVYDDTNRPLQPRNGRPLYLSG